MKLHYSPGSCALGIHVLLEEIGAPYDLARVDYAVRQQYSDEYRRMNPKSRVPVLQLDDGAALTEYQAIAVYLAELHPEKRLIPQAPLARARMNEAMHYLIGTIHADGFRRVFRPYYFVADEAGHEAVKARGWEIVRAGLDIMETTLGAREWLTGDFSLADITLFYIAWWTLARTKSTAPPGVSQHFARMMARPAVRRALAAEGLA